jgi:hypothetical protein
MVDQEKIKARYSARGAALVKFLQADAAFRLEVARAATPLDHIRLSRVIDLLNAGKEMELHTAMENLRRQAEQPGTLDGDTPKV